MTSTALPAAVRRSLHSIFGIRQLRAGQQAVIARVLAGDDTLAIMPTGAGKSLCYQLPALHLDGTTLVISPLIALIRDQADKLDEAGIGAQQFNSAVPEAQQQAWLERLPPPGRRHDIVFATPERLADAAFIDAMKQRRVALVVVDEAHCISQWGHDFRPAFLDIGPTLGRLGDPPVLALTATATTDVVDDIRRSLGRPKMAVLNTGVFRPNLRLQVVACVREDEKYGRLREALSRRDGAGIVYTATVKACDQVFERLQADGEAVTRYHGRLPAAERQRNQDRFMDGDARVMVATNAFGMGIDRADLRFVLHWQMPGSLHAYYQEAGRAGRDGAPADCALLFFRRDRQVQQFFLSRRPPAQEDLQAVLERLRAAPAPLSVAELDAALPQLPRQRIAIALAALREGRLARADRARRWRAIEARDAERQALAGLAAQDEERAELEREALERMVFYAQTGFCRWRVLLEAFDEALPFDGGRCGRCDNCLRAAAAAAAEPIEVPADTVANASADAPAPAFRHGDAVRVPRYGEGRVEAVSGDEVTVTFPDSRRRSFVAAYVEPAGGLSRATAAPALR